MRRESAGEEGWAEKGEDKQEVSGNVMVKVYKKSYMDSLQLQYSQKIILTGSLFLPSEAFGTFSYKQYLKRQGIFCQMVIKDSKNILNLETNKKDPLYQILSIRNHTLNLHQKYMKKSSADFIGSLVFGAKASGIDKETQDKFRKLGLSHILAASGFQVALLLAVCLWIGKFIGKEKFLSKILIITISTLVLGSYIIMTGAPPSIQRAGVVGFLTLIGIIFARTPDPLPVLILAGLMILLYSPVTFYDIGFQMSVLATFGLIYTVPFLIEKMKFFPKIIAGFIAVPLSAQLWVLPIQLHYFGQFSWLFLPANLISAIFVAALSYLGFISSALALIFPFGLIILCPLLSFILNIYLYIVDLLNKIPHTVVYTSNISILIVILSFILLLSLIEWAKHADNNFKPFQLLSYVSANILIFYYIIGNFITFNQLTITFLPVRNGESCVIQTPFKKTILIDGGAAYGKFNAGERYVIPYLRQLGINTIDLMILSCPDYEHIGGLIPIFKEFTVKQIWESGATNKSKTYKKFLNEIIYNKIPYSKVHEGQNWDIEPYIGINIITPLLPPPLLRGEIEGDMIFKLIYKNVSVLFTGNINDKKQEEIVNRHENIKAEIFKISAKGTKKNLNVEFFKKVNPKIVVICSEQNNRFGYSYPMLNNTGVNILRTDTHGQITITTDGNKINTSCFSPCNIK